MGERKAVKLVYPRVLTEKEHNRMEEVLGKGVSTFIPSTDQILIDCGLLERSLDKVIPCMNEEGNDFYYEADCKVARFIWVEELNNGTI